MARASATICAFVRLMPTRRATPSFRCTATSICGGVATKAAFSPTPGNTSRLLGARDSTLYTTDSKYSSALA